ncbi:MAG: GyrI-like domain-containing protein [Ktedonobacteraceae bacterium]
MITPQIVTQDEKQIAGVTARTSNTAEANPETAKIPALWQRFFQIADRIPHRVNPNIIFGAYTGYENDYHGQYSLIVSAEADGSNAMPEGVVEATLPAGKYMLFVAEGQMPQALIETWGKIWKYFSEEGEHARAYTTDYERHDMNSQSKVEVYIAIK